MKKIWIVTIIMHFLVQAANSQEAGFFLDDWETKLISPPEYVETEKPTDTFTATIKIDMLDTINKVPKYIYGNNANVWSGKMVDNPVLIRNIKNMNPHVLRWPGGNLSNDYFWNLSSNQRPTDIPADRSPWYGQNVQNWEMSTDEYYNLLQTTGCEGIICVNYSYARYGASANPVAKAAHMAAEWVRYDNGRTRFWEIGNENYGNWQAGYEIDVSQNKDGQPQIISGELYGKHCKVFIDSMKAAAAETGAEIKIGVVAYEAETSWDAVQTNWNEGLMPQVGDIADFYTIHNYFTPYEQNSSVRTILNSYTVTGNMMNAVINDIEEAGKPLIPIALTEYNIFAVGSMQ